MMAAALTSPAPRARATWSKIQAQAALMFHRVATDNVEAQWQINALQRARINGL